MRTLVVALLLSTSAFAESLPSSECGACTAPPAVELVRVKRTPNAAVWIPGVSIWMTSYVASIAAGFMNGDRYTTVPVFGALGAGVIHGINDDAPRAAGYLIGGFSQLAGLVTFIVGAAAGPEKLEKLPVQVAPLSYRDGAGMGLAAKF